MNDVSSPTVAHQLATTLCNSEPEHHVDQAYLIEQSKPRIAAMKSDCCGSNNYQNQRLAHK